MQDIEFTIQEGKLFMLQTRNGKRGGGAAVKIAVDLVKQGLVSKEEVRMPPKMQTCITNMQSTNSLPHPPVYLHGSPRALGPAPPPFILRY